MRRPLMLSAALLGLTVAAHAQTAAPVAPAPAAAPPEAVAPAAPRRPAPRRPMRRPAAAAPMTEDGARPGHTPGVGESFPASNSASNITAGDSRSVIAPTLPAPAGGSNSGVQALLADANRALAARQTGRAQEALERAETAMLQRSVSPDMALTPSQQPDVQQVQQARRALASGNMAGARQAISAAMAAGR